MAITAVTLRVLLITCEAVWIDLKGKRYHLTNTKDIIRKGVKRWFFIYSHFNEKTGEIDNKTIQLLLDDRRSVLYDYEKGTVTLTHFDSDYTISFKLAKGATPRDIQKARIEHKTPKSAS